MKKYSQDGFFENSELFQIHSIKILGKFTDVFTKKMLKYIAYPCFNKTMDKDLSLPLFIIIKFHTLLL